MPVSQTLAAAARERIHRSAGGHLTTGLPGNGRRRCSAHLVIYDQSPSARGGGYLQVVAAVAAIAAAAAATATNP